MTATNAALFRPCTSNAGPVKGGSFLFDRGQEHSPRYHQGLDIGIPVGTPLYASGSGTVISAAKTTGSGGWMVTVDYPIASGTVRETTMHHSRIDVVKGQQVTLATQIGLSGGAKGAPGAGDSTGPHVHFEIHVNGVLSDPANYLNSRSKITTTGGGGTPINNNPAPPEVIMAKPEFLAWNNIYWPNGWFATYDPSVYGALKSFFDNNGIEATGTEGTAVREINAANTAIAKIEASMVVVPPAGSGGAFPADYFSDADASALLKALQAGEAANQTALLTAISQVDENTLATFGLKRA